MQRFYFPPTNFRGDYLISQEPQFIAQLTKVLRAKHGDKFIFFNNTDSEYVGQLVELSKKEAKFLIIDSKIGQREPLRRVTLYQSLLKSDKLDWIIQKAVELGVAKIVPVYSRYSIVKDITPAKRKRYEEIIKEATEQCGGVRLAELTATIKFSDAVSLAGKIAGAKVIAWEKAVDYSLSEVLTNDVQLFIGPEGGYHEEEIAEAVSHHLVPVTLGQRILRAETAAIVSLARLL